VLRLLCIRHAQSTWNALGRWQGQADPPLSGAGRLEAACARALEIGARSYTSVNSILKNNLDRKRPEPATDGPAITHTNIRGPRYFH